MRALVLAARDIENPRRAGGDITMWEVARRLAARGDEVVMLCSSFPGAPKHVKREGFDVFRLGGLFTTAIRAGLRYRLEWRRRTDVVIEEALGGLRIPYTATAYAGVPVVSFWYQTHRVIFEHQFGPLTGWALSKVERLLAALHRGAYLLTCSQASKEALLAMGFASDWVEVYYPGPSPTLLAMADRPSQLSREPVIVMLGKIRRYKSFDQGIPILRRLKEWVPEARLVIAGRQEDTLYERRMETLAKRLNVAESVSFAHDLSEEEKGDLLRRARVHLICSPVEGFGLTAIEANLFGTPVVASDGVAPEAVEDGITGFRVPFADIEGYAKAIRRVFGDDALFQRLSSSSIRHARGFSWDTAAKTILAVIDRAARKA